jgi:3-methyladenine DNA glycosylase AlkD
MSLRQLQRRLASLRDPERAELSLRYFKAEDRSRERFLGARLTDLRRLEREFQDLPLTEIETLLRSRWHEERLLALLIMVRRYRRGSPEERQGIFDAYLRGLDHVDNWDLVDASAPGILGPHLAVAGDAILDELAGSDDVWRRRVAVLATYHLVKQGRFAATLRLAQKLLHDRHDMVHKALGWMLREIGKRDVHTERRFLDRHASVMPRVMLRYAIERLPEEERRRYLQRRRRLPPA